MLTPPSGGSFGYDAGDRCTGKEADMKQTLILTGDIHLGHVDDPAEPFALVEDVLGGADVVFGNLEGCLYDPSVTVDYKPGWHHVGPEPAPALMHGGFHALGCANNVNFGAEAVMATVARLDEMGIAHTGAGARQGRRPRARDRRARRRPVRLPAVHVRVLAPRPRGLGQAAPESPRYSPTPPTGPTRASPRCPAGRRSS